MLVRREAAEQVGWLDPDFFVYSDETDFCKRLGDAGWRILYVPAAQAVHHDQMASDAAGGERRIVEFHRNRDRYLRKHKGAVRGVPAAAAARLAVRPRALAARWSFPATPPRRYWLHARQALRPGRGEGIREAAEAYNRRPSGVRSGADPDRHPDVAEPGATRPGQLPRAAHAGARGAGPRGRGRLDQPRGGSQTKYLRLVREARAAARRFRPDVVFAHFLFPAGVGRERARRAPRTRRWW